MKWTRVLLSREEIPFVRPLLPLEHWLARGVWPGRWVEPKERRAERDNEMDCVVYRTVFAPECAGKVRLHIAAESVYRCYLDGVLCATGPESGDWKHTFFDSYDWEYEAGTHTLCILVSAFGTSGPYSRIAIGNRLLVGAEGACAEALFTNEQNYTACRLEALSGTLPFASAISIGMELHFDQSRFPAGVLSGQGGNFAPVRQRQPGGDAHWQDEIPEWLTLLEPAALPEMCRRNVPAPELLFGGGFAGDRQVRISDRLPDLEERAAKFLRGAANCLEIAPHQRVRLLLYFDNYYCLQPELSCAGGAGAKLDLGWCEALAEDDQCFGIKGDRTKWKNRYLYGIYDHFYCDGSADAEFFTLHYRAGRYASLEITTAAEPLRLTRLAFHENRYPLERVGEVRVAEGGNWNWAQCFQIGVRTLEMCSHDTYLDCPYYEQLQYLGDTRLQALVTMLLSPDRRLVRRAIRLLAASQLENGLMQSRYPSRVMQVIPTFTPFFIGMVCDYLHYGVQRSKLGLPERQELSQWIAAARRGMDAFDAFYGEDGLVRIDRSWNFIDWTTSPDWQKGVPPEGDIAEGFGKGCSGVIQTLILYAYEKTAELCELGGEEYAPLASYYRGKRDRLWNCVKPLFYDEKQALCRTALENRSAAWTEHAQVLLLLSNVLAPEEAQRCAKALCERTDLVRCTVYFSFYLFRVYRRLRRGDLLVARICEQFFVMNQLGLQTMLEEPEPARSDCHAWSAQVIAHMLQSMLGMEVQPDACVVRIAPLAEFATERLEGRMVLPDGGAAEMLWTGEDTLAIELPEPWTGTFEMPGATPQVVRLQSGRNEVDCSKLI